MINFIFKDKYVRGGLIVIGICSFLLIISIPFSDPKPNQSFKSQKQNKTLSNPVTKLKPKNKGKWIISKTLGSDVDSNDINEVILAAQSGDVIEIRDGFHPLKKLPVGKYLKIEKENYLQNPKYDKFVGLMIANKLFLNKDKLILNGLSLVFRNDEFAKIAVMDADLSINNCLVASVSATSTLTLDKGKISIKNSAFVGKEGADRAIVLKSGEVIINKSNFISYKTAITNGISKYVGASRSVTIDDTLFTKNEKGIYSYENMDLLIKKSKFIKNFDSGISLSGDGKLIIEKSQFSNIKGRGIQLHCKVDCDVSIRDSLFKNNEYGIYSLKNGRVFIDDSTFADNYNTAIHIFDGSLRSFSGLVLKNNKNGIYLSKDGSADVEKITFQDNRKDINDYYKNFRIPAGSYK